MSEYDNEMLKLRERMRVLEKIRMIAIIITSASAGALILLVILTRLGVIK